MKNFSKLLLAAACLTATLGFVEERLSPSSLLKQADAKNEKMVVVSGKVTDFSQKVSRAGNPYFVFKLKEGESVVSVYGRGNAATEIKDGVKVLATGIFRKEKKVGDFTVKNEVDVSKTKDKPYGVRKDD